MTRCPIAPVGVTVNGTAHAADVEPRLLLSDFLRHELGLTGTHVGCEHGVCGACTVLLDGEPVRSCLMFAVQADGAAVTTVEGLAPAGGAELHPLQAAFREAHGLQCGFCTPGILMSMVAVPARAPGRRPNAEIREALSGNLCRCTGYANIVRGRRPALMAPYLGSRVVRNEDARLLTGRAQFVDDVQLPGMLHAAFLRSDRAHAPAAVDRRRRAARQRPGVVAVYTAADLGDYWQPGPLLVPPPPIAGLVFNARTQVPLAKDKVRHVGEPLAMVVAESRYLAEDALADIVVRRSSRWRRWSISRRRWRPTRRGSTSTCRRTSPRTCTSARATTPRRQRGGRRRSSRAASVYDRGAAAAIENRGVVASWDAAQRGADDLGHDAGADSDPQRPGAACSACAESQVRVIAPFIGGGFGPKIMMFYPEEVLVPWAARCASAGR